ncbi:MAG: MFS transporter, partial [Bacilli bacterium]
NALMDSTRRFARIVGPGLTGLLLIFLSLPDFFTLDAITFAISALSLILIKRYFQDPTSRHEEEKASITSPKADIVEAILLLRNHNVLKWSLLSLGLVNCAWGIAYMVGASLFTKHILLEDIGVYGLLGAVYGIGNILSLFIFGSGGRNISKMFVGQVILGIGFLIFATSHSILVASIGIVIAAFGSPIGDLILLTLIQTEFPSKHIGKIYSMRALIGGTGLSLGALIAGPLFSILSIQFVIATSAIFIVCVGVIGIVCMKASKVRSSVQC